MKGYDFGLTAWKTDQVSCRMQLRIHCYVLLQNHFYVIIGIYYVIPKTYHKWLKYVMMISFLLISALVCFYYDHIITHCYHYSSYSLLHI